MGHDRVSWDMGSDSMSAKQSRHARIFWQRQLRQRRYLKRNPFLPKNSYIPMKVRLRMRKANKKATALFNEGFKPIPVEKAVQDFLSTRIVMGQPMTVYPVKPLVFTVTKAGKKYWDARRAEAKELWPNEQP